MNSSEQGYRFDTFLSYARADKDVAHKLAYAFAEHGIRAWFDEWELSEGGAVEDVIESGLRQSRSVTVLLSRGSSQSAWLSRELAVTNARPNPPQIFLIRVDSVSVPSFLEKLDVLDLTSQSEDALESVAKTIAVRLGINFTSSDARSYEEELESKNRTAFAEALASEFAPIGSERHLKVQVHSGPAEVLVSGCAFAFVGNPIQLQVGGASELSITFMFTTSPSDSPTTPNIVFETDTRSGLLIKLVNFANPLGVGTVRPIKIGRAGNRVLYIHVRAQSLTGSNDHLLTYCIYAVLEGESA